MVSAKDLMDLKVKCHLLQPLSHRHHCLHRHRLQLFSLPPMIKMALRVPLLSRRSLYSIIPSFRVRLKVPKLMILPPRVPKLRILQPRFPKLRTLPPPRYQQLSKAASNHLRLKSGVRHYKILQRPAGTSAAPAKNGPQQQQPGGSKAIDSASQKQQSGPQGSQQGPAAPGGNVTAQGKN